MPDDASSDSRPEDTPLETKAPRQAAPSRSAAGVTALLKVGGQVWQTGAVLDSARRLLAVNQKDGFDCQSCAWPSPDGERHVFEFCENGAKAVADEATARRITRTFFAEHAVAALAERSDHWLNQQGRLTEPMVLRAGATHYTPISWDDAFALIGRELRSLRSPDEAAFYTSGRTSNEAAFLYQLFARQFGTNNLPDCSNLCHESSGAALGATLGVGKGTVTLEDFEQAEAIFIIGQNPGTNHPRMLTTLAAARARGARIVSINPLPEVGVERFKNPQDFLHPARALSTLVGAGAPIADVWVQPRINGDLALFKGVMKELLADEETAPGTVFDHAFIAQHTVGFEALIEDLRATPWEAILASAGVARHDVRQLAEITKGARSIICCWAMGLTQQPNAVETIQTVVNFLLLRGNLGRPGAGVCPVRGHSNVQGGRTMGIWERMPEAWLDRLDAAFGFRSPRRHGLDAVGTIRAMHEGRVQVFFGLGGNFLSASPDTHYTADALRRTRLTVQVSTKLNRSHLVTGRVALILPCLGRSERDVQAGGEQFVTVEDSMGIVNASRGRFAPAAETLLSEPMIVARLARATLQERTTVPWDDLVADYGRIRERIACVVPGFERFNERIQTGLFRLPNPVRDERRFAVPGGCARFTLAAIPPAEGAGGEFVMMTIRSHDQFNTTVYGLDDRYRGIFNGRRVVFMHPEDMTDRGLVGGQLVDLVNRTGGVERWARFFMVAPYRIPRGCVATYFPEANVLVPIDRVAAKSHTPVSKCVPVSVVASDPAAYSATLAQQRADLMG